jgi:hypothetical protein
MELMTRTCVTNLIFAFALVGTLVSYAQIPTQNLFRRAQFIEYLRLRNQSGVLTPNSANGSTIYPSRPESASPLVEFKVNCKPEGVIFRTWLIGEMHFAYSRWTDAAEVYAGLLRMDSAFCDAYFRLSQCNVAQNNLGAAYNILTLARTKFPDNPLLNLGFGQLYTLLSYPKSALYYFEKQTILHPADPEGYLGASWVLSELGRDEDALVYLKKGRELILVQINDAVGNTSFLPPALSFNSTVRPGPSIDYLFIFESMLYHNLNQNENSAKALQHLSGSYGDDVDAYRGYCQGMYYYSKGEKYYDRAKRNIRNATAAGIYVDRQILLRLGIHSDPTDFRAMALRENYNDDFSHGRWSREQFESADSLFQNGLFAAALPIYSQQFQQDSTNMMALARLAACYHGLGQQAEAIQKYTVATHLAPGNVKFRLLLARELFRANKTDEAIIVYQQAAAIDKKNFQAIYGACLAMAHAGDFQGALAFWLSAKKQAHYKIRDGCFIEGTLYYMLGFYNAAYANLSHPALAKHASSKYYLALSYYYLGEQYEEQASSAMLDAISLGAIVTPETESLVGLDPNVHHNTR